MHAKGGANPHFYMAALQPLFLGFCIDIHEVKLNPAWFEKGLSSFRFIDILRSFRKRLPFSHKAQNLCELSSHHVVLVLVNEDLIYLSGCYIMMYFIKLLRSLHLN